MTDPTHLLAQLAELRATDLTPLETALLEWAEDVARRHTALPYYDGSGQGWACSYEWADGDGWRIDWRNCPEVRGLARALGMEETA